jgi:dienelactone hydrolase
VKKKVLALLIAASMFTAVSCSAPVEEREAPPDTKRTEEETTTTTEETTTSETTEESTSDTSSETSVESEEIPEPDFSYETSDPVITSDEEGLINIEFMRDDLCLGGRIYLPEGDGPFPTVIVATGLRVSCDEYEELAENFAQQGIACVLFDFAGGPEGESHSDGEQLDMCLSSEVKDLNAVLDGILTLDVVDADNIFLFGHSFGGEVSTVVAAQRENDINSLILMEPAYLMSDLVTMFLPEGSEIPESVSYPYYLGHDFIAEMLIFDVYEYIPEFDGEVILFAGDTNDALGLSYPQYFEEAGEAFPSAEVVTVEGADHAFSGDAGYTMFDLAMEFINENIV